MTIALAGLAGLLLAGEGSPSEQQIRDWIAGLQSQEFAVRKEAAQALVKAGAAALPALERAAESDDLEAAARAIGVLGEMRQSKVEAVSVGAVDALKRLSMSNRKSVAKRASEILNPPKPEPSNDGAQIVVNGIQVQANAIQIQAIGGQQTRRSIKVVNGRKEIEVVENDRQVQIVEEENGPVEVTLTEPVDGKKTTKTWKGKSLEDLKKNEPEGFKVYQQYANAANPLQGLNLRLGRLPPNFQPRRPVERKARLVTADGATLQVALDKELTVVETRKVDGEEKETVYTAADIDDFKKKYPEAFERFGTQLRRWVELQEPANKPAGEEKPAPAEAAATKTLSVTENGQTFTFEVSDKGIQVTETTDGDSKPRTVSVRSAEELREKYPELYRLYKQARAGRDPAQAGAAEAKPQADAERPEFGFQVRARGDRLRLVHPEQVAAAEKDLAAGRTALAEARKKLETLLKEPAPSAEELRKVTRQIAEVEERLADAAKRLAE